MKINEGEDVGYLDAPMLLPVGREEFETWSDRIIAGCGLPATPRSMKFGLASMLLHLSPTEDKKPDSFFIRSLRKGAVSQVAHAMMEEIKEAQKAEDAAAKEKEVTPKLVSPVAPA